MQSLSKYNEEIKYLLCAIDLFSKYAWVIRVPLKDKSGITIVNAFQKIISKRCKPKKIWVDQGGEFYDNFCKRFFKINNIEMDSTYNEGKSVVVERFIRSLKSKILKYMTAVSKNVYFDELDDIVNKSIKIILKSNELTLHLILVLNTIKILMKPSPNLKLVIMSEYQNTKTFL